MSGKGESIGEQRDEDPRIVLVQRRNAALSRLNHEIDNNDANPGNFATGKMSGEKFELFDTDMKLLHNIQRLTWHQWKQHANVPYYAKEFVADYLRADRATRRELTDQRSEIVERYTQRRIQQKLDAQKQNIKPVAKQAADSEVDLA